MIEAVPEGLIAYDGFDEGGASPGAGQYKTGTGYIAGGSPGAPGDAFVEGTAPPWDTQGPEPEVDVRAPCVVAAATTVRSVGLAVVAVEV